MTVRSRLRVSCSVAGAAVVAAALAVSGADAQPLPGGIDECRERIAQQRAAAEEAGAEVAVGPLRLGAACPELADRIDAGPWGPTFVEGSARELSTSAFEDLVRVAERYERGPQGAAARLSTDSLDDALAALELEEPDREESLWERFQKWFDERLSARDSRVGRWIDDWLANLSLPERLVRYALIVLGALLVAATVAVIVNELRVAGVLAGDVLRKYAPLAGVSSQHEAAARTFDDVARAPLARRPGLLLQIVVDRLRAEAKAPLRDSLTHRELVTAAGGLSAEQSDSLRAVATAAESATFGGWRPEERDVDELTERGRALVASLGGQGGTAR